MIGGDGREGRVTVGVDLGDRTSQCCVLRENGQVQEEFSVPTTQQAFRRRFSAQGHACVVLEAGGHSPWVTRLLAELGHEVIVANPAYASVHMCSEAKHV